jgi:hypothetical protein
MPTTFLFEIDWSNAGSWVDESANVLSARLRIGMAAGAALDDLVAQVGTCLLTLDNSTRRYSPDYASGPLYGNLLPRRPVRVRATDGVSTWTLFRGTIDRIEPQAGLQSRRQAVIACVDALALLRDVRISMDLQRNRRADQLIAGAVNLAFGAPAASGTITFTTNPASGDSVTIAGVTYTFRSTFTPAAYEVQIGATKEATASNLKAAINSEGIVGTTYTGGTERLPGIIASVITNVVTVTATLPGSTGNEYGLAKTGSAITLSGSTLTGGVDYPPGLFSYCAGNESLEIAADRWTTDRTAALDTIRDSVRTERGRFFVQRDGTLTFYDRKWFFTPLTTALALGADPFTAQVERSADQVYNLVNVTVHPRATAGAVDVLARTTHSIRIPSYALNGTYTRTVTLYFRDSAGNVVGGTGLVLPLVAGTDYSINDRADGTGFDYTGSPSFAMGPLDVRGSEVRITFYNYATGPLYVTKLQVRGQAITVYDPLTHTQEDAASQSTYLKRGLTLDLPLSADEVFGEALAYYLLDRFKTPFTNVQQVTLHNTLVIGGVNVFSLDLFDVFSLTDSQSGISAMKCTITGIELDITAADFTLTLHAARADDRVYWNLGVAGYGELDTNTRLAV